MIKSSDNKSFYADTSCIKWLNVNGASFKNSQLLSSLIEKNSDEWILKAKEYRDDIAHRFSLSGMKSAQTLASDFAKEIEEIPLYPPEMPDGQSVYSYARLLAKNLEKYTFDFISLLPQINIKMLSKEKFILV